MRKFIKQCFFTFLLLSITIVQVYAETVNTIDSEFFNDLKIELQEEGYYTISTSIKDEKDIESIEYEIWTLDNGKDDLEKGIIYNYEKIFLRILKELHNEESGEYQVNFIITRTNGEKQKENLKLIIPNTDIKEKQIEKNVEVKDVETKTTKRETEKVDELENVTESIQHFVIIYSCLI